jgi:beta-lactamase superfamily II metal-dependent hydrolase
MSGKKIYMGILVGAILALCSLPLLAQAKNLVIYFIDVEGGQATLFIAPSGQSVLVDTGWPGDRDASRIAAVAKSAGLKQIDDLLITHYHTDHAGGAPMLATKIPIRNFFDHGETVEHDADGQKLYDDYQKTAAQGHHVVVTPGFKLPVAGLDWTIVSAAGKVIEHPLPGAGGPNPACGDYKPQDEDTSENARSAGSIIVFGRLRIADLGDLTWNKEGELVCPVNKLGGVDIFIVSHHGLNLSNSPALVAALQPRVAIMDNGATKGAESRAWSTIHEQEGLEDLWQLHFAVANAKDQNAAPNFIANPNPGMTPDDAYYLKLTAGPDGRFEVTNQRNGFTKKY